MHILSKLLEINSIVIAVFGSSIFGITMGYTKKVLKKVKNTNDRLDSHEAALVAMLHDKLFSKCTEYLDRGWCSVEEMDNLSYLYDSYHNMGGNGTGSAIYNRVLTLPTISPDEKKKEEIK